MAWILGCLVNRLHGYMVGYLVDLVAWLLGLFSCLVTWLIGYMITCLVTWLLGYMMLGYLVAWLYD